MFKRLWPFLIGSMALGLGSYVIAGILPDVAGDLHVSPSLVGQGVTAFTAAYAITGPLLSGVAGLQPRRSLIIAISVFSLANIVTAISPNAFVFILSRVVVGAAAGVYSPLSSAVAARSVPEEKSGAALSLVLAGLALGTVLGVPIGLIVAQSFGWRLTIALITLVGVLALAGIALNRNSELEPIPASSAREPLRIMGRTNNVLTVLVTFLMGTASLGVYTYIAPVLAETPLADNSILGIWMWGLGGAVGAFGIGYVLDRFGHPQTLVSVIIVLMIVSFLALQFESSSEAVVIVALFAWGLLGWSSLAPQQQVLLQANPKDGATAVAANSSGNYLGSAFGAALGAAAVPNVSVLLWGAIVFLALSGLAHIGAIKTAPPLRWETSTP